jgi:hypothetical protein
MFSLCFRMCQIILDVQFVFLNVSDHSQCSVCVSECVRLLSVQNVSDHSRCSVCVSECVRLLSVFSLCFKMFQIILDVQFVFLNVPGHS